MYPELPSYKPAFQKLKTVCRKVIQRTQISERSYYSVQCLIDYTRSTASKYKRNVEKLESPKEGNQDGQEAEAQNMKEEAQEVEYMQIEEEKAKAIHLPSSTQTRSYGENGARSPEDGQKTMVKTCSKRNSSQPYRKDLHNEGGNTLGQAAKRTCKISIFAHIHNSPGQGLE